MKYDLQVEGLLWKTYPELIIFKEGVEGVKTKPEDKTVDQVSRFILLFLSRDSPYASTKRYEDRVSQCMKHLEMKKNTKAAMAILQDSLLYKQLMFIYFRFENDHLYELWVSLKMAIHNMNSTLRNSIDADTLRKTAKDISDLVTELVNLEATLFGDKKLSSMVSNMQAYNQYAEKYALEFDFTLK